LLHNDANVSELLEFITQKIRKTEDSVHGYIVVKLEIM